MLVCLGLALAGCVHTPDRTSRSLYREECRALLDQNGTAKGLELAGFILTTEGALLGGVETFIIPDDEYDTTRRDILLSLSGVFLVVGGALWASAHLVEPQPEDWEALGCLEP
ncbi:MAG: hypothetical protein CMH57_14970 [Myxococcales bacterium]|nr:hypothetical protein [Myxococcales bacterium]